MEYVIGPVIAAVLGLNISLLTGRKLKADVKVSVDKCIAKVEFVVFDEADRLFEMGFAQQYVRRVLFVLRDDIRRLQ